MCGITGMVGHADPRTVLGMTRLLAHRGPDGEGVHCPPGEPFGFGHRRLAILDLSPAGAQPMSTPDGRFWATYNGEVFNFRDIRAELESRGERFRTRTDTEVLLAAYAAWGRDCLHRLNGMFAFAIWDRAERRLFAARDRLGVKPLYYAEHPRGLVFASELKAILGSGLIAAEADPQVTHNPWHYPSSPRTGFVGIVKLPPGHVLEWHDGRAAVSTWWSIPEASERMGDVEARRALEETLPDAVRLQMVSDVPVGALLSGGLDSTTVVSLMTRFTEEPVRTLAVSFRDADVPFERMPDDAGFARTAAGAFGCRHTTIELDPGAVDLLPRLVWHLDEPIFDPAAINTYLIASEARRQSVPVLLSGVGADEAFGGYRKHRACLLAERYRAWTPSPVRGAFERAARPLPVATSSGGLRSLRWLKRFLTIASLASVDAFLQSDLSVGPAAYAQIYTDAAAFPYDDLEEVTARRRRMAVGGTYLDRMCRFDTAVYLPDHNLAYTDKASMAVGVETRPPLLDHRVVEIAFRLADEQRIRGSKQKALLREVASAWIPPEIARRPKASFAAPLRAWIRRDLVEMIDDLLSETAMRRRGLYDPRAVRSLIEEDRRGRDDHAHLIWNLLNREIWLQTFIDAGGKALTEARAATQSL
jgi:asparagine synthase (glutamine-hydrolysing)